LSGQRGNVRKPWTCDEKSDKLIAGREDGRLIVTNVGYARVSTIDQDPALQLDALAAAGCAKVFEDRASGARGDRAGLRAALDYVRQGDMLIVWKLDRLGRSLPHLIETVTSLATRGVGFCSLTEAIDTTTPGGRLVFHLFGALGQFERDLIQERTRAGLVAAATRGRKGGRKPVVTAEKLERARTIIAKGLTVREAAVRLKVGKTALYDALRG
jgi:DNA invertase Pin-like site-specific DNA recombinase